MEKNALALRGRSITVYGSPAAGILLVQPADGHDLQEMDREVAAIAELSGSEEFCLAAVGVDDWNRELSPWEAPPVFGSEGFGSGAGEMLAYLTDVLLPWFDGQRAPEAEIRRRVYLGGYSLAGFFALWSAYRTAVFDGTAAVSPSVWFPGWTQYAGEHRCLSPKVYLSLGDREERTRNRTMAGVGDAIREQYRRLSEEKTACVLEWNPGNHFRDAGLRTAKGFSWLMNSRTDP